jgi:hypothetical protein
VPHSNFYPELEISDDGNAIKIAGPLADTEADTVAIVVTAFVTQSPDHRANPPEAQQGPTGMGSVELDRTELALASSSWECTAHVEGGPFREDWAYASAELTEKAENGAIERYTWSQWVWLRHP